MVEVSGGYKEQDWLKAFNGILPLFDAVRPNAAWTSRDTVHKTAHRVGQFLEQDLELLRKDADFIFSMNNEPQNATRKTVDMLRRWHLAERAPSLAALSIFAIEHLKPILTPDIAKGILAASVLGEVENTLPYHNNLHYKKVLLQIMRMISVHNEIYEGTDQAFDGRQIGLLILAASIHDLGHDGKGNTIKGVFEQGRLERRAFELATPYLEACGMNDKDLEMVKVMLLCTDVAPLGDPANPINQMKAAYRYHFLGQKKKIGPLNLDPELSALQKDADLTMMGIILHEADISTSAGLDYSITAYETSAYKKEMGEDRAFPEDVVDFLNDICHRQMLSDAGQRLYAANMARIFALAEKEIADGNHAYPQMEHADFLLLHRADNPADSGKPLN